MKEKMKEMDSLLGEALKKYDFKRRKKGIFNPNSQVSYI